MANNIFFHYFGFQISCRRTDGDTSERVSALCVPVDQLGTQTKTNIQEGEEKYLWLTYIIEKGEYCQPIWLIFGFRETLVLIRVVMDNVELKDNAEQIRYQNMSTGLLFKCKALYGKQKYKNCDKILSQS